MTHTNQVAPQPIRLQDYRPTPYIIEQVHLHFDLYEDHALVRSVIHFQRNPAAVDFKPELQLHGEALQLQSVAVDGAVLTAEQYRVNDEFLSIENLADVFVLETVVRTEPQNNTQLSGLYKSSGNFCTQNEPHGFRRITYFYDRPDVMTRFTTCISADKIKYPLLLANGNLVESKDLADGRHWVKWEDPSKKPCYLFALVAGDLEEINTKFTTCSGRSVDLRLFVEKGFIDQADYALGALERAMRWDEEVYGREYDLDVFMIVAVSDFNMGAMENKGLNIFNTKYILAKPETATDADFIAIEEVIGHEYFHNWSGNRVTCRDWFQITLKEGLTVFRDQNFTMDMTSAGVKRIDDVNVIRNVQFMQDAGPMAHPIRPEEYMEINNFYTVTVYNKGAEVIRMLQTMLGKQKFREALDLYFSRHDESAVTTEDFVQAMQDVSGRDFTQFMRWYSQAGTPTLVARGVHDPEQNTWTLSLEQCWGDSPGQPASAKKACVIPVAIGLLDAQGAPLALHLDGHPQSGEQTLVLELTQLQQQFVFTNITSAPIPSLLRDFSAPVILDYPYTQVDNALLLQHDSNDYVRWDAAQRLITSALLDMVQHVIAGKKPHLTQQVIDSLGYVLEHAEHDKQLAARLLLLPCESYLLQQAPQTDITAIYKARQSAQQQIAVALQPILQSTYAASYINTAYQYNPESIGKRALANVCLSYLLCLPKDCIAAVEKIAAEQFMQADNMTQQVGALQAICQVDTPLRDDLLQKFFAQWQQQPLIMDKWFALQAASKLPGTLQLVESLLQHPQYDADNPNKVRALIGTFAANLLYFHAKDASGYQFLTQQILLLDAKNPQVAARLCEPLTRWRLVDTARQESMKMCLQQIKNHPGLSKDVYEVVAKSLVA